MENPRPLLQSLSLIKLEQRLLITQLLPREDYLYWYPDYPTIHFTRFSALRNTHLGHIPPAGV